MRTAALRTWASLVRLRRRWGRFDDRTLVITGVCLADALGSVNGLTLSWSDSPERAGLLVGAGLLSSAAATVAVVRGRLGDLGCALCLTALVVAATAQALSTPPSVERWTSVYGLAGVPMLALLLARRRGVAAVTAAAVVAQLTILASTDPPVRQLVTDAAVVLVCLPVFVGYTAVLLRRSAALRHAAQHAAEHDHLTGLLNRHGMARGAPALMRRARARGLHVGVVIVDVDHFKAVNDTHGHDAGDTVLGALGGGLAAWSREGDLAVRLGGEEFAVIGLHAGADDAAVAGERLRASAERVHIIPALRFTVSVGVAALSPRALAASARPEHDGDATAGDATDAEVLSRLLSAADAALYRAKTGGRNRVEVAQGCDDLLAGAHPEGGGGQRGRPVGLARPDVGQTSRA